MPAKDPVKRRATKVAWQERNHTPEYMRWLGARRKLRIETGDRYVRDLEMIRQFIEEEDFTLAVNHYQLAADDAS